MREQGERLEDQADIPLVGGHPFHPLSPDPDLSSVWLIEPGDQAHHRGLAAPAGADHRDEFPSRNLETQPIDRRHLPEPFGDPLESHVGFHHTLSYDSTL